ncbi:MAG: DEAD/DEAH box helicase [Ignavibacteriales bacterium]
MTFKDLGLITPLLEAIEKQNYKMPSPIQEQSIPHILKGRDVLGCAQTGTGKTAAFALPILQNLIKDNIDNNKQKTIKALILTPTRELAMQIRDNFRTYGADTNIKCSVIFGGVNQASQIELLKKGVDVLVATPGRLLDLINQKYVKLDHLKTLVLDEADTMLDMGFIKDVKKIISFTPNTKQTLLFSATMSKEVINLSEDLLVNHVEVKIASQNVTADKINQSVYFVDKVNKPKLLLEILNDVNIKSVLIFSRTKHGANKLAETLEKNGIMTGVLHGNKSQTARVTALSNFKNGQCKILIATDIAARGIDINELSHVINYEIPEHAEVYVHRIGRTARAGFSGIAISLCDINEKSSLKDIEKLINQAVPVVDNHNYLMQDFTLTPKKSSNNRHNSKNNNHFKSFEKKDDSYKDSKSNNNHKSTNYSKRKNNNNFSNKKYR